MRCKRCRMVLTSHKQAFSMSAEGPVSAFVNPGGVIHETATFFRAKNIVLVGESRCACVFTMMYACMCV